jgi:hypothetical protein
MESSKALAYRVYYHNSPGAYFIVLARSVSEARNLAFSVTKIDDRYITGIELDANYSNQIEADSVESSVKRINYKLSIMQEKQDRALNQINGLLFVVGVLSFAVVYLLSNS